MAKSKQEVDLIVKAIAKGFDGLSRDLKKVGDSTNDMGDEMEGAKKKSKGLSAVVTGLAMAAGTFLLNALADAGRALIKFGKESIDVAGNVAEMESKFDITFGKAAPEATKALEDFAEAANRSKFDLKEMAAEVGSLFVPLGFARDAAADMSVELTKLAVDVGSFNNKLSTDVLNDFKSALIGSHETVAKYGVILNDTTLKAELLRMGIEGGMLAASGAEKAQARLNLIYKGTADAQGDAIETSESYANVSEGLDAAIKGLSVAIGKHLVPAATEGKIKLTGLAKATTAYFDALNEGMSTNDAAADFINRFVVAIGKGELASDSYKAELRLLNRQQWANKESGEALFKTWVLVRDAAETAASGVGLLGDKLLELEEQEMVLKDTTSEVTSMFGELTDSMLFNAAASVLSREEQINLARQMGLLDETTFFATERMNELNTMLSNGTITAGQYREAVLLLKQSVDSLQDKQFTVTMILNAIAVQGGREGRGISDPIPIPIPVGRPGGQTGGSGFDFSTWTTGRAGGQHSGLDMIVPPGFPNDSFPLGLNVESGERVQVTPASKAGRSSGGMGNATINVKIENGMSNEQAESMVERAFERAAFRAGV